MSTKYVTTRPLAESSCSWTYFWKSIHRYFIPFNCFEKAEQLFWHSFACWQQTLDRHTSAQRLTSLTFRHIFKVTFWNFLCFVITLKQKEPTYITARWQRNLCSICSTISTSLVCKCLSLSFKGQTFWLLLILLFACCPLERCNAKSVHLIVCNR